MKNTRVETELEFWKRHKEIDFEKKIWGRENKAGKLRADRRIEYITTLAELDKDREILELGCGSGFFTEYFAKKKASITALELSPENLEKGEKKRLKNTKFVLGNAEALEFKDESFDAIVGVSILHHTDIDKTFKEIFRCLKEGGVITFSEPNLVNPYVFLTVKSKFMRRIHFNTDTETALIKWVVKKKLKEVGFRDVKVRNFDFLHPLTPNFMFLPMSFLAYILEYIPIVKEFSGSMIIFARK